MSSGLITAAEDDEPASPDAGRGGSVPGPVDNIGTGTVPNSVDNIGMGTFVSIKLGLIAAGLPELQNNIASTTTSSSDFLTSDCGQRRFRLLRAFVRGVSLSSSPLAAAARGEASRLVLVAGVPLKSPEIS